MHKLAEKYQSEHESGQKHARAFIQSLQDDFKFSAKDPSPGFKPHRLYSSLEQSVTSLAETHNVLRKTISEPCEAPSSTVKEERSSEKCVADNGKGELPKFYS